VDEFWACPCWIAGRPRDLGWFFLGSSVGEFSVDSTCINHSPRLAMHIHPELRIRINGEAQEIPAGVGVSIACMKTIHTHDADNVLHLEAPMRRDFTLGEFFRVWDKPFSATQILDAVVDDQHEIILTANGQTSDAYENLVLHDKDLVVIEYREKALSLTPPPTESETSIQEETANESEE